MYFNLCELPLSIRILGLSNIKIFNLESILPRLIHLETLNIPDRADYQIMEYPPNLKKLYVDGVYEYKLVNLPSRLRIISLGWYNDSLEEIVNSNIEHIDLYENMNLSVINNLPKSLKKITIIETHPELHKMKKLYPYLDIDILPDYDERERIIDSMRGDLWW